jgi:hypothetical protein
MAPRTLETPFRGKTDAYAQPTASERAALAADRARIADLNAQILELESSLQSLKENRELVQSRLNAYTYPVLTLPNEVVSEIFVHVLPVYPKCPPPIGHLSPNLLCQICQKWRSIALTTPAIWRAISLSLRKIRRLEQKHQLLDDSLGRSGSCLLSIKLHSNIADDQKLAQFGQTIADKCAWWEHLQLCIPDPLNVLPNKELSLPFLRTLRLGPDRLMSVTRTFLTAPLLQKVDLASYSDAYGPIFPWSQLTVLSVDSLSWNQYADILNQLVNISYCRFRISPISVESNVGESR